MRGLVSISVDLPDVNSAFRAGVELLFDDTEVQQARRDVIAGRPPRALSTLLRGDSIVAGAVTVDPAGDDPFAGIFPARRLMVGRGLFGRVPAPPGPDIERHGSGAPWLNRRSTHDDFPRHGS